MWTIIYTNPEGQVEAGPVYGLESTARMAAEWRSKKRQQTWVVMEVLDGNEKAVV